MAVITANGPTTLPQIPAAGSWPSAGVRLERAVVVRGPWLVTGVGEMTAFVAMGDVPSGAGFADVVPHATKDENRVSAARVRRTVRAGRPTVYLQ